ncbi:MAG: hypothetical protein N3E49_09565 [Bacteroidia bacterium]|nr:hypothetical protein [Bacteroidia bacterium]
MTKRRREEARIEQAVATALRLHGWIVAKVANEVGYYRRVPALAKGFPDLIALRRGRAVFLEVKAQYRKPTPVQTLRHEQLRAEGFEVRVVRGLADVEDLLTLHEPNAKPNAKPNAYGEAHD